MSKSSQISQHETPQKIRAKLPTTIIINPRAKIGGPRAKVGGRKAISENVEGEMEEEEQDDTDLHFEIKTEPCQEKLIHPPQTLPKFPLQIAWCPNTLCFILDEDQVTHRLWITNRSDRTIFLQCCGLWNDTVRHGASWCCFPRTRIWLPSGLRVPLYVRATPRNIISPIPEAVAFMQIAAAHLRDNVTGYFSIPIKAKFLTYMRDICPMAEGE